MSRVRIPFQNQAAFIGPLATGFHFCSPDGALNNNFLSTNNFNLLQQLDRVISANYTITTENANLKQLGTRGTLSRPLIQPPSVILNFDYYINGIKNEARLGFDVNYARYGSGHRGDSWYNSRVCPISGFVSRELVRITGNPFWTHTCKDFRNIFFVVGPDGRDIRESKTDSVANEGNNLYRLLDAKSVGYEILGFGNCYLDNYSLKVSVGSIPQASVSYTCENLQFYTSGGGTIPGIKKQDFTNTPNIFLIPKTVNEGGPSVLKPGDIFLSISGDGNIFDIGVNFNDAKVQSFNLDIPFNREPLNALGWVLPVDRQITPPIISTFSTELILGDGVTGALSKLLTGERMYNINVSMKSSSGCKYPKLPAFQIDIFSAILKNASFNSTLDNNKTCNLSFTSEIDVDDLSRGVFFSGLANIDNMNSLPTF